MIIHHVAPLTLPLDGSQGGATQRRIRALAAAQRDLGHEVHLHGPAGSLRESLDGVVLHDVAPVTRRGSVLATLGYLARIRKSLASADVAHYHGLLLGGLVKVPCPSVLSIDYPFTRWRTVPMGSSLVERSLLGFSLVCPVSRYSEGLVHGMWPRLLERTRVLWNGVDTKSFHPDPARRAEARARWGLTAQDVVIGYVGRLSAQKGADLLAPSIRRLQQDYHGLRVLVAGPSELFGITGPSAISKELVAAGAIYLGLVEDHHLPGLYNALDIAVVPTRTHEMFGMVALEAAASGCRVVAHAQGGLPEVLGLRGPIYFDSPTPDSLTAALRSTIRSLSLPRPVDLVARSSLFDWAEIARMSIDTYASVEHRPSEAVEAC